MKKITFLVILMTTFITNAQIILSEDFESSTSLPETWTNDDIAGAGDSWAIGSGVDAPYYGDDNGYFASVAQISGNYAWFDSVNSNDDLAEELALTSPALDCSGLNLVVLSFNHWYSEGAADPATGTAGEAFVEVSNDGGASWVSVASFGPTAYDFDPQLIDITDEVGASSSAHVRFRWTGNRGFFWAIDNVLVQQPEGSAPDVVTNMMPADMATDVDIMLSTTGLKMINFSWDAATTGDPATSYNWYFGETADAVTNLVANFDGTVDGGAGITYGATVDAGWQPNTTYYWKVASVNAAGSTESAVYSFTTGAADPLGIEEISLNAFNVSPNPVKDVVTINTTSGFDTVEVFNQLGQSVLKSSPDLMNSNRLDLSSLNPGIYLMQIRSNNKSKTVKIIKE